MPDAQNPQSSTRVKLNDQYGSAEDYQAAVKELIATLPQGMTSTELTVLETHGKTFMEDHAKARPTIVVYPTSTENVVTVVNISRTYRVPIIAYSGATSMERHHLATDLGGICVDMSRMNHILKVNEQDGDLVCEAGAKWVDINKELRKRGIPLFFPLDPGLGATIGGMMATGCSGTNAVRYGTAKGEWFLNATIVLPSGEVIKTRRRARKCSAGFDSTHIFIGAEGTLGIVTEATIRLAPVVPTRVAVVQFPDVYYATQAATKVLSYGVGIQCVELLDTMSMRGVNLSLPGKQQWPEKDSLFFKLQGPTPMMLEETARLVREVSEKYKGTGFKYAASEEEAEVLWEARKNLMHALISLFPDVKAVGTDVCVPISRLPDLVRETKKDFDEKGIVSPIIGHVGDGNFHCMFTYRNDSELEAANAAAARLVERALELDGTCTGEHGVGEGKRKYLIQELGAGTIDFMKTIKQTLDPLNLFNPGKLYPD